MNYVDKLIALTPKAVAHQETVWGDRAGVPKYEGASEWLLTVVPFPVWMPAFVRKAIIKLAIELTVKAFNYAWGKVWNSQKLKFILAEGN